MDLFPSPYVKNYRRKNRLAGYDYSSTGYYFITICIDDRVEYFGRVENKKMILNDLGQMAEKCWLEIPVHFSDIILDEFVIMPNHVHGNLVIKNNRPSAESLVVGNKNFCSLQSTDQPSIPWQTQWARSISSAVRGFKIGVTKWCRKNNYTNFQWQKSFYDHIIRNEESYRKIKFYIQDNPNRWEQDRNNRINLYM